MAAGIRCKCQRCTCNGLIAPAVLITIGVLFLVGRMNWTLSFERLWPVLLIVIGAVKLAAALASTEGHISS